MQNLIILPNQLFLIKYFKINLKNIIIIEHPYYFTRFKFHKLKLAFLVGCMKNYKSYLEINNFKTKYIKYDEYKQWISSLKDINYCIFDPIDDMVKNEFISRKFQIIETPMFLFNRYDLEDITYRRLFAFYNLSKKMIKTKYNLDYTKLENQDVKNRGSMTLKQLKEFEEIAPEYTL